MAQLSGITVPLEILLKRVRERSPQAVFGLADALQISESTSLAMPEAHCFFLGAGLTLNKTEFDSLFEHFPAGDGVLDLLKFSEALMAAPPAADPLFYSSAGIVLDNGTPVGPHDTPPGSSPTTEHLALSGNPHADFHTQLKPFPAHWGNPPNMQMKGHDGIMRELPGGYGKGNQPMAKWVTANLQKDKKSETTVRGVKPFPYGNYSL